MTKRTDGRQRVVAAAAEVFQRDGFQTASMARVAEAAGVSKGLPYHYFSSKHELAREVVASHLKDITGVLSAWPAGSPSDRLAWFLRQALTHARSHQPSYRLYLSLALQPATRALVLEEVECHRAALDELDLRLRTLFGELGHPDPGTAAVVLRATVDGLIQYLLVAPDAFPLEDAVERVLSLHTGARSS